MNFKLKTTNGIDMVNNDFFNYSQFQIEMMRTISKRSGFEGFVTHGHNTGLDNPRKKGPVSVLWYEGHRLIGCRLGVTRSLSAEMMALMRNET